jgi:hypothetical protein
MSGGGSERQLHGLLEPLAERLAALPFAIKVIVSFCVPARENVALPAARRSTRQRLGERDALSRRGVSR